MRYCACQFLAPGEYWRRLNRLSPEERAKWDQAYKKEEDEFRKVKGNETEYDHWKFSRFLEDYLRCIVSVDESVGRIINFLKENGLDKNTVVVYTSDQGVFLGEHGLFDKRFMYEEAMRTPLIIKYPPEIASGSVSDNLVQNLDIPPTLLDMAGVKIPDEMQGRSLREIWKGNPEKWRDALYYHYYEKGFGATPHYGIRTTNYKLIHFYNVVDSWEFYDLKTDPSEMNNLINNPAYTDVVNDLKMRLKELQEKYKDNIAQSLNGK